MKLVLLNDLRRMLRDQFLVGTLLFVVLLALGLRFILPAAEAALRLRSGLELGGYYPLVASYLATTMGAVMAGLVVGMLLLENREHDTISALRVSPMTVDRLLWIEGGLAFGLGALVTVVEASVVGVGLPSAAELTLLILVSSLFAPLMMLLLATFASNKLEAFALLKVLNLLAIGPLVAYFIPEPWQFLAAILPPYGVMKAWWVASAGGGLGTYWHWLATGLVVQAGALLWLRRRFLAVVSG